MSISAVSGQTGSRVWRATEVRYSPSTREGPCGGRAWPTAGGEGGSTAGAETAAVVNCRGGVAQYQEAPIKATSWVRPPRCLLPAALSAPHQRAPSPTDRDRNVRVGQRVGHLRCCPLPEDREPLDRDPRDHDADVAGRHVGADVVAAPDGGHTEDRRDGLVVRGGDVGGAEVIQHLSTSLRRATR